MSKSQLWKHLQRAQRHQGVLSTTRRCWVDDYTGTEVADEKETANQVDGRPAIASLQTLLGFQCNSCSHRSISQKATQQHNNKMHDIKTTSGRQQESSRKKVEIWMQHWMQSIFDCRSPHYHLFIMQRMETTNTRSG